MPGRWLHRSPRPASRDSFVAVSTKAPPRAILRVGAEEQHRGPETAALLRGLGHDIMERVPGLRGITMASQPGRGDARHRRRRGSVHAPPRAARATNRGGARRWATVRRRGSCGGRANRRAEADRRGSPRLWEEVEGVLLAPGPSTGACRVGVSRPASVDAGLHGGRRRAAELDAGLECNGSAFGSDSRMVNDEDGLPVRIQLRRAPG